MSPEYVWHYTPVTYLEDIQAHGALKPSNAGAPNETPLLWFSTNQRIEATALKAVRNDAGGVKVLTFAEQLEFCGCARFGLSKDDPRLMTWRNACDFVGMSFTTRRKMERVGTQRGGNPLHWLAVASEVPLSDMVAQVYVDGWKPLDSALEMALDNLPETGYAGRKSF